MAYFGMVGTGRWSSDERPEDWRQELLYNFPRGSMPITAITSKTPKPKPGTDPAFHWWEKNQATNTGAFTAIYTDQAMSDPYATTWPAWNAPAGTTLHMKVDATADTPLTDQVRVGAILCIMQTAHYLGFVRAKVTGIDRDAGADARITFKTLDADTAVEISSLSLADRVLIMPTLFPEFGGVPEPLGASPTDYFNYTSIKKSSVAESRTAMSVRSLRPDSNNYNQAKIEALENLGIQMEWEIIYGKRLLTTDPSNNQPLRYTMGIREYINTYGLAANLTSYKYDTDFSGKTWLQGGYEWLMAKFMAMATYTDLPNMLHVVGNGVKMGLTNLAERRATINITTDTTQYGLDITKLITPFGTFNIVDAPLFNQEPSMQYTWIGIPNNSIEYITLMDEEGTGNSDIKLLPDMNYGKGGMSHVDGRFDIWLVENGYKFRRPREWFMLYDVGRDNAV